MSLQFDIRRATPEDLETIVEFNIALAAETEDTQLNRDVLTSGVLKILNDSAKGEYFVAVVEDRIVGQIMYTREWSDWRDGDLLWLQSVYVAPDFRRHGIFRSLLGELQKLAETNPAVAGLRLYVEKENTSAQETYRDLGFDTPGYFVMQAIR